MVLLAMRRGAPQTAQQVSAEAKVPIDYLFKVLQSLSRAGLNGEANGAIACIDRIRTDGYSFEVVHKS